MMMFEIPIKLPEKFEAALGYHRGRKWVAFYWEPCGDESEFDDGICCGTGNWMGFLEFVRHPKVSPWLKGHNLGSSDQTATDALLCDLESRDIFIGARRDIVAFLAKEAAGDMPPGDIEIIKPETMEEILKGIREAMAEIPAPSIEEIEEKVREDYEAVQAMVIELGGKNA
jgi:hypothetical protein